MILIILFSLSLNSFANTQSTRQTQVNSTEIDSIDKDELLEMALTPLKVAFTPVTMLDPLGNFFHFLVEIGYVAGYSGYFLASDEFHKKFVNTKTVFSPKLPTDLDNKTINTILGHIPEDAALRKNRIALFIEEVTQKPKTAQNIIHESRVDKNSSPDVKRIMIKDLTKKELETALQKMGQENIKIHAVKTGRAKVSGLKLMGSFYAIAITAQVFL
jgi:hypothetical protein